MLGIILLLMVLCWLITIGVSVFTIICYWLIYKKAGKEGWESIVPVYNAVVLLEITGLPMWNIAFIFIPLANIYFAVRVSLELAYRFNKSTGFGIGLFFLAPIFLGILAFDKKNVFYPVNTIVSYCSKCGEKLDSDTKYCTSCGTEIKRPKDKCLKCGAKLEKGDKFCKSCGNKVD